MSTKTRLLLIAAAAAALAAFTKRPVRPPETTGAWRPADQTPSHR